MAVGGILTGPTALNQASFDQLKREITLNGKGLAVPIRTEGGPGGTAVWTNTVQSQRQQERTLNAQGSESLRLAPTQFAPSYTGHLLDTSFHNLNPAFRFTQVDFHA